MFPKMGMNGKSICHYIAYASSFLTVILTLKSGKYIGDKYPRCSDRPAKHFLKSGAKYVLLGSTRSPSQHDDPSEWEYDINAKRIVLQRPSNLEDNNYLYNILCNQDSNGNCQFKSAVELNSNLKCIGEECTVDTMRVVQVNPGIFYEYIQQPCVETAFYDNALKLGRRWSDKIVCADPKREVASSACCETNSNNWSDAVRSEKYWGERMTYKTAKSRCSKLKRSTCKFPSLVKDCVEDK